ncbi:molybdopterin molybdotransferase MoeA [Altererythrobacter sp. Root672]|uniref:molybdopterin molybdotransferase MoeA n=1 Tax=Altererythrobacter sp. Root672 TaxID=1736584 RepID=UPI0006FEFC6A|nr:molybdopterin molybdotransferase MoeA [Altererythrobacter sp. Root672]KRA83451.1 molybdopterin biosynthesis protein [Altererythrobacter sp. Root672]
MTPPLPLIEAQQRLLDLARPLGPETVTAEQSLGRYLWNDLSARRTQPAADLSAMDGYAVQEPNGGPWRIVGESAAGRPFAGLLEAGEAIRISTGALMPEGAVAVLLQEEALRDGSDLTIAPDGEASARHIRRKGFDFAIGDTILQAGTRMGPAQLALVVSAGLGSTGLETGSLPRVAVIDNGDELAVDPAAWDDHRLPASNGAMIAAMVQPLCSSVDRLGPVPDSREALAKALGTASDADVIVTSGGASVGDHDLVRPALEEWGASIDFWRVAMKPGKPLLVARKGDALVLGLPGNPVSSYVTAFLFLLPLLRRLAGANSALPVKFSARTATALPPGGPRLEMVRAQLAGGIVTPLGQQDSSGLRALAIANALIERPIDAPSAAAGDEVSIYWLQNGGMG